MPNPRRAVRIPGEAKAGVEYLARAGYAAKGVVYGTIGVLATMTAFGFRGGRIVGTQSAIETLQSQPFGQVIAWAIVVGLAGYVVWRFVQAVVDPEHKGSDAKGLLRRAGLVVSGSTYATLAFFTASELLGGGSGASGEQSTRESTATAMQYEWGAGLVGFFGLAVIGVGCYQFYRAYALTFTDDWRAGEMDAPTRRWATRVSRFGITARAASFGLIGWFFLQAARQADASEAVGLAGALQAFSEGRLGTVWLAAIGVGFVCYGLYCMVNARFRRINP